MCIFIAQRSQLDALVGYAARSHLRSWIVCSLLGGDFVNSAYTDSLKRMLSVRAKLA